MDNAFETELPVPWNREGPMTRELLVDGALNGKARFHVLDPWHTIHLGVGKTWVASGVMMLQELMPDSAIDRRVVLLGEEYKQFCRRMKLDAILRKIDINTFGTTTEPIGAWNKAAITSNFMMFLEDFCDQRHDEIQNNERLRIFVS